jgi:hypothetical protein
MTTFYCLRFETPPTRRTRSPYLYPQGYDGPVIPPGTRFLFRRLLRLAGLRWKYSTYWLESESYITTDGQSASPSWNKAYVWGLRPDFYYCQPVADLLMWGALTDERTGLSFTIAAGLASAVILGSECHGILSRKASGIGHMYIYTFFD